jgi:hypothetical protein
MRTTSLKTIYLTEKELKQAIANWIELEYKDTGLAGHLEENACEMTWSQNGKEFIIGIDGEIMDNIVAKDDANEQSNDHYVVKVQEAPNGALFVALPQKLIDQLGWEVGDEVEWDESEICEDWGEHKGLVLGNKSKLLRDADEARKKAVSIGME